MNNIEKIGDGSPKTVIFEASFINLSEVGECVDVIFNDVNVHFVETQYSQKQGVFRVFQKLDENTLKMVYLPTYPSLYDKILSASEMLGLPMSLRIVYLGTKKGRTNVYKQFEIRTLLGI